MKTTVNILWMICCISSAACQDKSRVALTLEIKDADSGDPIEAAQIETDIFDHWRGGEGFGQDIHRKVQLLSNANGIAHFDDETSRCELVFLAEKNGYYRGSVGFKTRTKESDRWQPWNPTIEIILKRIRNPIPLIAKVVNSQPMGGMYAKMPVDKAAYDLEIGDWTAPYGSGVTSDLVFEIFGKIVNPGDDFDTTFKLSFSNAHDGMILVRRPGQGESHSKLKMPYEAPIEGYAPAKSWRKIGINPKIIDGRHISPKLTDETKPDEDYFLRLRTKVDEKGNIISAHYAKVQDSFLWNASGYVRFIYYFNPTPNDRNLEFDPKRNLMPGKPFERVFDP